MEKKQELNKNEELVYKMMHDECVKNVYCYNYISKFARILKIDQRECLSIIKGLEEKKYIRTYGMGTPFFKQITNEAYELSYKLNKITFKFVKDKDKSLDKILDEPKINTMNLWIYLKLISFLRKKMVATVKEITEEMCTAHEGKHNWINSRFVIKMMNVYEELGFSQWEKVK